MSAADWSRRREQVELALAFLGSWWREWLIVAVLAFAVIGWHRHNADQQAIGALREKMRVADSTLKVAKPLIKVYDTQIIHDTLKLNRVIAQLKTLHDTARITDTVWVKQYIAATDSLKDRCTELAHDCDAFRVNATQVIAAQDVKIHALESLKRPHPCGFAWSVGPSLVKSNGYHAGVGVTAGIGCRF